MATAAPKSKMKKVHTINQRQKVFRAPNQMLSVLMWGVNHMMSELDCVPAQPLILGNDFKAFSKVSISNHCYNDQVLPSKYKIKEYCPLVFRDLRERFNEDPDQYTDSLSEAPPVEESEPGGRSHSQVFFTHDRRLVIKTLGREEVASFHQTFPAYHGYIVERHGETLLPQYLGMYRITVGSDKEIYCLVMRNIFSGDLKMHKIYDLKGSTVDRAANEKERLKELPTFKDNDFTEANEKIYLSSEVKAEFMATLKMDAEFLCRLKLMDYSLLVGIHDYSLQVAEEPPTVDKQQNPYAVASDPAHQRIYCIGIIDVLTRYGAKKMAAHTAKGMKHGREAAISTVNPEQYCRRFQEFTASIME